MRTAQLHGLLLVGVLLFSQVSAAAAQESGPMPCEGTEVSGTIVELDEEAGLAIVDMGDGFCTVKIGGSTASHPLVALLGSYFEDNDLDELTDALAATQVCVILDPETEAWAWADCDLEGAVEVTVTGEGEDGAFSALMDEESIEFTIEDEDDAQALTEALEALQVDWTLTEDGRLADTGDQVAEYHKDGWGFGVLTKFFAIAAESRDECEDEAVVEDPIEDADEIQDPATDPEASDDEAEPVEEKCGVTVEELMESFRKGGGIGHLFREYGKPSIRGVGHVRHASETKEAGEQDSDDEDGEDADDATEEVSEASTEDGGGRDSSDKGNGGGRGHGRGGGEKNGKGGQGKGRP